MRCLARRQRLLARRQRLLVRLQLAVLATVVLTIGVPAIAFGATAAPHSTATAAPAGSIGIRLLDVLSSEASDPRALLYIVDHVAPGAVVERRVEASNTTSSGRAVALYAAGATIESGLFIGDAGRTPNDMSSWTSVNPAAPQIPAGGTATATVRIAVPADAPAGERYAVVWAEVRSSVGVGGGVTEVNRVGIRIYLFVGAGAVPADNFTIGSLTAQRGAHGNPEVIAMVRNTGGRALDMSGALQLSGGPGGLSAGPFPAVLGVTLAIGATEPVVVSLNEVVPSGPWLARITLRSGLTVRTAQATVTFPQSGSSSPVTAVAIHRGSDAANTVTVVVVAWMIAAVGIAVLRRRHAAGGWLA